MTLVAQLRLLALGWYADCQSATQQVADLRYKTSLLRQIAHSPKLDWPRYTEFQKMAKEILNETESPTLTELPPLEYHQTKRVEHKLHFRR